MAYNDAFDAMWKQLGMIISGFLDGYLMQARSSSSTRTDTCTRTRADTPPFNDPHSDMECIATHGIFKLYAHKGVEKQSQNDASDARPNKTEDNEQLMKYCTKRADGRWQASKTIDGKRIFVYGKTQAEAIDKLRKLSGRKQQTPRESFYKFAIWWADTFKKGKVTEKTYQGYVAVINTHLKITTPINKITYMQLQEILNKLVASRMRVEVYQLMRQICKKAYELDFIKKDISQFLDRGKIEKPERRALTLDEQTKLLQQLGNDMFSRRVMFYLCTGARPSEIATVRKDEIRPGWLKINGTKTKGAVRWVKVSERLTSMLQGESPEFFKFDAKKFRMHLQRVCIKAGITYDVDTYTLRHTFATNLYILRVPEKDRQTYMGHAPGSAMTNGVYTTFSPDITAENIYDIYGDWYPKF